MKSLIAAIVVLASLAVGARGQTPGPNAAVKTTTVPLDSLNEQQARNVKTEWVTYKGRKALRVIDTAPRASAALKGTQSGRIGCEPQTSPMAVGHHNAP